MALQLNTVRIAGNLGADPKVRTTETGKLVCNLRVATNEYAGKDDACGSVVEHHAHTQAIENRTVGAIFQAAQRLSCSDACGHRSR